MAAALRQRGVATTGAGERSDARVLVVAETVKPDDLSNGRPALIVLTKADLAGTGPDGPLAIAKERAAVVRRRTGVPTVPMVGPLAVLTPLDDELMAALRAFATEPPNLAGVDAFVTDAHAVGRDVRARLLDTLDRFGVAHAVLAVAKGAGAAEVTARLRRLGNADEVVTALDTATASARYRRVRATIAEIRALAVRLEDDELHDLLASDGTAMAVMSAAVAVLEADGLEVDRGDTPAAHRARAVRWAGYGHGPVDALHRRCSADVVRGSLRLLATARDSA